MVTLGNRWWLGRGRQRCSWEAGDVSFLPWVFITQVCSVCGNSSIFIHLMCVLFCMLHSNTMFKKEIDLYLHFSLPPERSQNFSYSYILGVSNGHGEKPCRIKNWLSIFKDGSGASSNSEKALSMDALAHFDNLMQRKPSSSLMLLGSDGHTLPWHSCIFSLLFGKELCKCHNFSSFKLPDLARTCDINLSPLTCPLHLPLKK